MFKKIDAPKIPRAIGDIFQLLAFSAPPIVNILSTANDFPFLLLNYIIIFVLLYFSIATWLVPHMYIKNNVLFTYKHVLYKPREIQIDQIKEVKIYIGKWLFKGTFKLVLSLENGHQFTYRVGMYSGKKFYHKIKAFFENGTGIENIKTL